MKKALILLFIVGLFGCSNDEKIDHKSIYCGLTKNEIPENQVVYYLHDRDSLGELAMLSWKFKRLAKEEKMLSKKASSIFLVSKNRLTNLMKMSAEYKAQFSFLFKTNDFVVLQKENNFKYSMNLGKAKPDFINYKNNRIIKGEGFSHLEVLSSDGFPFSLSQKVKELPGFEKSRVYFRASIRSLDLKQIELVINVKTKTGKSIYYKAIRLGSDVIRDWTKVQKIIDLPEFVSGEDNFKMYLYNSKKGNFLLRDFKIKFNSKSKGDNHLIGNVSHQFNNNFENYFLEKTWSGLLPNSFVKESKQGINRHIRSIKVKSSMARYSSSIENMKVEGDELLKFSADFRTDKLNAKANINFIVESESTDTLFYNSEKVPLNKEWSNYRFEKQLNFKTPKNSRFRFWIECDSLNVRCDNIIGSFISKPDNCN